MKKNKFAISFRVFKEHEIGLMQKLISCVMVFFILISLISIRKIEVEVGGFVKESVRVSVKTVSGQVSFIYRIYLEKFSRVFVGASEGVLVKEQRARGEVERIIANEIMLIGARFIEEEGARGGERGERTGEGNSLMASVGYLMAADVYEMEREIKKEGREGDMFVGKTGVRKRGIGIEGEVYFKIGRNSIGTGDISKDKEGKLLLAKELSMIDLWGNNKITGKEEIIKNIKELSLLKR